MIILPEYVGPVNYRAFYYSEPEGYYDQNGEPVNSQRWRYNYCVMDDYGNAVPVPHFQHGIEDSVAIWVHDGINAPWKRYPNYH